MDWGVRSVARCLFWPKWSVTPLSRTYSQAKNLASEGPSFKNQSPQLKILGFCCTTCLLITEAEITTVRHQKGDHMRNSVHTGLPKGRKNVTWEISELSKVCEAKLMSVSPTCLSATLMASTTSDSLLNPQHGVWHFIDTQLIFIA